MELTWFRFSVPRLNQVEFIVGCSTPTYERFPDLHLSAMSFLYFASSSGKCSSMSSPWDLRPLRYRLKTSQLEQCSPCCPVLGQNGRPSLNDPATAQQLCPMPFLDAGHSPFSDSRTPPFCLPQFIISQQLGNSLLMSSSLILVQHPTTQGQTWKVAMAFGYLKNFGF